MLLQHERGLSSEFLGFSVSVFFDVLGRLFEMETGILFFLWLILDSLLCVTFCICFFAETCTHVWLIIVVYD